MPHESFTAHESPHLQHEKLPTAVPAPTSKTASSLVDVNSLYREECIRMLKLVAPTKGPLRATSEKRTSMNEYEQLRATNMKRNQQMLQNLNLVGPSPLHLEVNAQKKASDSRHSKKKMNHGPAQKPTRVSARAQALPSPSYTDVVVHDDDRKEAKEKADQANREKALGYRLSDGRWRGERFGAVKGVPCGTVFGAGDYQREGRKEMTDTGFFRPYVTPEWVDKHKKGCYALILNNDNGLSEDYGNTIVYAGSGGRQRGQNRMAPQTFHQSWDNITNNALRLNCIAGKKMPVRVIRGPKLSSPFGTAHSGGGYRYDGLYEVTSADLVAGKCKHNKSLLTATFQLRRINSDGYSFVPIDESLSSVSSSVSSDAGTEGGESRSRASSPPIRGNTKRKSTASPGDHARPLEGARVQVRFDDGELYRGTIAAVEPLDELFTSQNKKRVTGAQACLRDGQCRVKIEYDDGDVEWTQYPDRDISLLEP